ncbi:MAG: hypothetical protein ABL974_04040 [Prosthecobacter sp.]
MNPPPLPVHKRRSIIVTLTAWLMMLVGIIGLPISGITVAMILVKSYGTQTSDPIGFVIIVLGPLILLITGGGLLWRKRWARFSAMLLLAIFLAVNAWDLIKGPRPNTTSTSASGVKMIVTHSSADNTSLPLIGLCLGLLLILRSAAVRAEFDAPPKAQLTSPHAADDSCSWRVGHSGRDMMYYEEKIAGAWQRIDIDGEMLIGRAHHVIYFASAERWQSYPEWAQQRRSEIMQRVMSEFREPDYEYQVEARPLSPAMRPRPLPIKPTVTSQQRAALAAAILIMAGIATGMGWLVTNGIGRGETYMPSKRASLQRVISRQHEPASFWAALTVYALIGLGSGGLALWGVRQGLDK